MNENNKIAVGGVLLFVLLAIVYFGFESKISLYIIIVGIILVAFMTKEGGETDYLMDTFGFAKKDETAGELDDREKKLLIFHILSHLEKRKSIDMEEIAVDLDVSIYALNDLIRFLDKHGIVEVIYPPMKNLPVMREKEPKKSKKLRKQIYYSVAKRNLLGKPMKEEFTREVAEYLESRKRERNSET